MTKKGSSDDTRNDSRQAETAAIRERLLERTCEWCGASVAYSGRGRPPRYCSPVHRRRAWELRTAQARAGRPVEDGGRSLEPVREIIQRTETVVRTVALQDTDRLPPVPRPAQRLSGQPYTLPEDAVEWIEALAALRQEGLSNARVAPFREHVARACERTAKALRAGIADSGPEDVASRPVR